MTEINWSQRAEMSRTARSIANQVAQQSHEVQKIARLAYDLMRTVENNEMAEAVAALERLERIAGALNATET